MDLGASICKKKVQDDITTSLSCLFISCPKSDLQAIKCNHDPHQKQESSANGTFNWEVTSDTE